MNNDPVQSRAHRSVYGQIHVGLASGGLVTTRRGKSASSSMPPTEARLNLLEANFGPEHQEATPLAPVPRPEFSSTILIVDDSPDNLHLLSSVLNGLYVVQLASSSASAMEIARSCAPDLILLDVAPPQSTSYELCRRLKADRRTAGIPIIFLTTSARPEDEALGFMLGGADFIHRPFDPATVRARVSAQLQVRAWREATSAASARHSDEIERRMRDIERMREAAIHVMVSMAEFRDEATGNHVKRTQEYVRALGGVLSARAGAIDPLDALQVELIARAAPLHDIGKVAIPDGVLLKPGALTAQELVVMKTHAVLGWEMLRRARERMGAEDSPLIGYAMEIARHHHERWDGTGYPDQLKGAAIPIAARLMAVADVYDALISRRPYKAPIPHATAVAMVSAGAGKQFDPAVIDAFIAIEDRFANIARQWAADPAAGDEPQPDRMH